MLTFFLLPYPNSIEMFILQPDIGTWNALLRALT